MSSLRSLGLGTPLLRRHRAEPAEYILLQRPLQRILAFTRRSIHDVINNPIARNEVIGYYKLYKQIQRSSEVTELERWWNDTPLQG